MGLLEKLWDDTVAGPRPDAGLGKLRKSNSIPSSRSPPVAPIDVPVTHTITIVRANSTDPGSLPSSPACSSPTTPVSPFSPGTAAEKWKKLMRRKSSADALERAEPRSPTVYDWVVISALDR